MRRIRDEQGVTLIELLVAMVMSSVLLGAVVLLFTSFMKDNSYAAYRDDAQAHAQTMVDRISRDLRTASSINAGSSGLLQTAGSYDMVFQTVSATPGTPPSGNASNHQWVRYCLDSNDTLWRQTVTPANTTSSEPDTSACPSTSNTWTTTASGSPCCKELSDVTNEIGGDNRPVFTYGPTGYASTSDIKSVEIDLFVDRNLGHLPGPTELTSGVYLRNELAPPVASFTYSDKAVVSGSSNDISLDGSDSSDPNGQILSYQWYQGSACPSSGLPSGAISGATTQQYDAGDFTPGQTVTFALVVTNTGGLTNCTSQQVTA